MTLTDFLLARLAEDERRWVETEDYRAPHSRDCDYPGDMPGVCTCSLLDELVADCEAKARIVESCADGLRYDIACGEGHYASFEMILGMLARPYDTHEDYDPAWRP